MKRSPSSILPRFAGEDATVPAFAATVIPCRARDVKAVHRDVHALLDTGILQKTEDGWIVFPFDAVHVNFMLSAA